MALYRSGYTMPLEIHNEMVRAMRAVGETNTSKYITRAVRAENKKHLTVDVEEFLDQCTPDDIRLLKQKLKKGDQ